MCTGHGRLKALANALGLRAPTRYSWMPNAWAVTSAACTRRAWPALAGCQRTATWETVGRTSLRNSSCFPMISGAWRDTPVMFPPGWARLATRPLATGSPTPTMTMGIVLVTSLAASAAE